MADLLFNGPPDASWTIALAHGAGAAMDTPFMTCFAVGLANRGFRVARFEFPYMAERRRTGKQRPPDRAPVLLDVWRKVIEELGHERLVIGGKSMGGRMASMVADEGQVAGVVCLGYPFHPTGRPERLRVEHLKALKTPALILQGTRDPFGSQDEVANYKFSPSIQVHWLADGDHGFKPRRGFGRTEQENLDRSARLDRTVYSLAAIRRAGKGPEAMTRDERDTRWMEIDRELAEIADGKVTSGTDPASREGELLEEQDRLEWEASDEWFRA